ncbi:MAG: AcvB/VirJ family lysyl-phosphatidylglycerol hydrolase [Desulfobacterales bacterium]
MNRGVVFIFTLFFMLSVASGIRAEETTDQFGRFGKIALYHPSARPAHVVLFVSGDGGWNMGVVDMARELAGLDALVVGVDITSYLKQLEKSSDACVYPAADFELLSKYVQKKLGFSQYITPVLIGYSSGATLAYAALVQAPGNTFLGAISLGFCPDLALSKPLCRGSGLEWTKGPQDEGYNFLPASHLAVPWVALQGTTDQVCEAEKTETYVKQVKNSKIVMLPGVGHGYSVPKNWMPQFKDEFARLTKQKSEKPVQSSAGDLADLPLVEVAARGPETDRMAVFWSGDGGWADLDEEISTSLAGHGVPVVGVNSLKYFWTNRTPEQTAKDLERIIRHYAAQWRKEKVILIGYSLGADILPFAANRLNEELKSRVELIALLGPSLQVDFEFHLSDWLGSGSKTAVPTKPEVMKLSDTRLLCIYGEKETDSLCPLLQGNYFKKVVLPGAHHFGGDYAQIAATILGEMK